MVDDAVVESELVLGAAVDVVELPDWWEPAVDSEGQQTPEVAPASTGLRETVAVVVGEQATANSRRTATRGDKRHLMTQT